MDESEWLTSDNAYQMLVALWKLPHRDRKRLKLLLHRYYLACCRQIWRLLPQDDSRWGVEAGEAYLAGEINDTELSRIDWWVEGAAFHIDYFPDDADVKEWVEVVRRMPREVLCEMLHPPELALAIDPYELLRSAAYFADYAMVYSRFTAGGETAPKQFSHFLSASLLRKIIGNPLRDEI